MLIYKESKIQLNVACRKKLKKVIDIEIIFWYINGATCRNPYISTNLKKIKFIVDKEKTIWYINGATRKVV